MQPYFPLRRILALLLVLASVLLSVSCGNKLHTVTSLGGEYFDKQTNTTYVALPASYEPIARGAEYGELDLSGVTYILHEISGLMPTDYLCSVYGDVYHSKDITVPDFSQWHISSMKVCTDAAITVSYMTIDPETEGHAPILDALQSAWRDRQTISYPSYLTAKENYTLRFESDDAPGLYFAIKLLAYDEDVYATVADGQGGTVEINMGRYFLYDRYSRRCVPTDDTIFRLLEGEEITP
jgi:hypothetical protein